MESGNKKRQRIDSDYKKVCCDHGEDITSNIVQHIAKKFKGLYIITNNLTSLIDTPHEPYEYREENSNDNKDFTENQKDINFTISDDESEETNEPYKSDDEIFEYLIDEANDFN